MSNNLKRFVSSIILTPLSFLLIFEGNLFFLLSIIFVAIISIYEWIKMELNKFLKILGVFFLLFSFFCFFKIRNINHDDGLFEFLIIFIVCISTDIGGFIFGKFFKGPKLTKISPQKTYSGAAGSFITSLMIIYFYTHIFYEQNDVFNFSFVIYICSISLISQIGDLCVSFFKRKSKIKDSGNIIPGHGGILDRIDGMILAFPAIYIFKYLF
jgi:phosphatidate cytidylyltransferase